MNYFFSIRIHAKIAVQTTAKLDEIKVQGKIFGKVCIFHMNLHPKTEMLNSKDAKFRGTDAADHPLISES